MSPLATIAERKGALARVNWRVLSAHRRVHPTLGGCKWITFESIQACLDAGALEDAHQPHRPGISLDNERIAYLVHVLRSGGELEPLDLVAEPWARDPGRIKVWFEDGSHRFRAYQFTGLLERIPMRLHGPYADLLRYLASPAFSPFAPVSR